MKQSKAKLQQLEKHIIVLFVETPRKSITAVINLRGACFHKQNYYIFYRHANIQRTYNLT
jgi:hypothetical protein